MKGQERLRLTYIFALLVCLASCIQYPEKINEEVNFQLYNKEEQNLQLENGLVKQDGKVFSGRLFSFFEGTTDTLEVVAYLFGKEHGEWRKFYSNHTLSERRYFTNGQKTGQLLSWWENGKKQSEYHFLNDEYQGTCREWSEEGRLIKIMNYNKGYEDGAQQWWYDNGKIKANYVIKNGRRYGLLGTKNCINVADSVFKQ